MSVSSVASSPTVVAVPTYDSKPQDTQTKNRDAEATHQPPPPAPLPPGQGTRIDQLA
jgi:DNA replication initiation complex subunit (GINS family)